MSKKLSIGFLLYVLTIQLSMAYTIGGAYAMLVNCTWGQWGYEYGHIGTYNVNGKMYQIFFGSSYCQP